MQQSAVADELETEGNESSAVARVAVTPGIINLLLLWDIADVTNVFRQNALVKRAEIAFLRVKILRLRFVKGGKTCGTRSARALALGQVRIQFQEVVTPPLHGEGIDSGRP